MRTFPSVPLTAGLLLLLGALRALLVSTASVGFDAARWHYAAGVHAGLIERSLLGSAALEQRLDRLERLTLGPWARGA